MITEYLMMAILQCFSPSLAIITARGFHAPQDNLNCLAFRTCIGGVAQCHCNPRVRTSDEGSVAAILMLDSGPGIPGDTNFPFLGTAICAITVRHAGRENLPEYMAPTL